ncbi:putative pyridoxal 5'-phosphate synthase (glutamine hydrolyzing) [Helianthus anomalus]
MSTNSTLTLYTTTTTVSNLTKTDPNPFSTKVKLAQQLTGGAIVHVTTVDQAKIAESAGASCITVSDPSRMPDPSLIKQIQASVPIPVMAKARVGHFVEAQILEAVGVDYIDENELLEAADVSNHINKHNFRVPFVCGCSNLGDGLMRVREGAAMIRTQGNMFVNTVTNVRNVMGKIRVLSNMDEDEVFNFAKEICAPYDVVAQVKQLGRLPVVHFASGGIVTVADAAMMMQLGCDGVFVDSDVFECPDAYERVRAIVQAVRNYNDVDMLTGLNLRGVEGSY